MFVNASLIFLSAFVCSYTYVENENKNSLL